MIAERIGDIAGQARHAEEAYAAFAASGMSTEWPTPFGSAERPRRPAVMSCRQAAIYTELAELAERIGDRWNGAIALNNLGDTANQSGDWERAVELCGRSSVLRRELGDEWGMALALCNVAFAELRLGRLSSAASNLRVALDTSMKIDAKTVVQVSSRRLRRACGGAGKDSRGGTSRRGGLETPGGARLGPESFEGGSFERALESIRASLGADADAEIQRGRERRSTRRRRSRSRRPATRTDRDRRLPDDRAAVGVGVHRGHLPAGEDVLDSLLEVVNGDGRCLSGVCDPTPVAQSALLIEDERVRSREGSEPARDQAALVFEVWEREA